MNYGYIRVSTDKQTVENQRYEITDFAQKNGIQIDEWIEETISGTLEPQRRQLGTLLDRVQKDDLIICSELSRLGRSLFMIMSILNKLMETGARVWTIKDGYRLGDDIQSKVLAFAFGLSAEIERNLISQRTKEALERKNDAYNQIKAVIPEFFEQYNILLGKANKYIHKQGFDTFYSYSNISNATNQEERTELFLSFLKHAIGMMLIMNIALDPLSLALSDHEVDSHIPFDPMTEPIPIEMFEKFLSIEIIDKIKTTAHYLSLKNYFLSLDELNEATYAVLRYNHFDVDHLDMIEKQISQLDLSQALMFCILKNGIRATHFYWDYGILGYSTSYKPKVSIREYCSNQFDGYLHPKNTFNCDWKGMYISICPVIGSHLIVQHDEPLTEIEITTLQLLVDAVNQRYQSEMNNF